MTQQRNLRRRALSCVAVFFALSFTLAVASVQPVAAQQTPFDDVPTGAYYTTPVNALAAQGVFAGTECSDGFCPSDPLPRWQMAVWIVRVLDGEEPSPISNYRFNDVDAGDWYAPHVERMYQLEVTTGCGDGSGFCPDREVSRAQMAVFLTRAFKLPDGPDPGFDDVPVDAWYFDQVAALAASGITTGCGDGSGFCPSRATTRAQMATFLHRAINRPPDVSGADCDFVDHSSRVVSAVYQVRTSQGIGTAFYIGNDEWLTAAHVIEGETTVALHNGDVHLQATVTAGDSGTDLALLSAPPAATTLRFGVLSEMTSGETMYAVGFPLYEADSPAVSRGVMSRIETDPRTGTRIATDAAVNPGNSGGPLLDTCGRVHGVVSFKLVAEDIEGIAYAVAVDQVAVNSLRASGTANLTAQKTYEECFGSGGDSEYDSDWTEGEGGWWHAVWTHRGSGPKLAGIALLASDTWITDYRNELPDGCDDWHADLRVECDASTREFWAYTWWSGLTVASTGGLTPTATVLDNGTPILGAWASDPGGKHTYVPAESVFAFIQLLPLVDSLQFKGYTESHDDPPVLDAAFDLDGADAALDHLTRECGSDPRQVDPNPQPPADPGDWTIHDDEDGGWVSSFTTGPSDTGSRSQQAVLTVVCFLNDFGNQLAVQFGLDDVFIYDSLYDYAVRYQFGHQVLSTTLRASQPYFSLELNNPLQFLRDLRIDGSGTLTFQIGRVSTLGTFQPEGQGTVLVRGVGVAVEPVLAACGY